MLPLACTNVFKDITENFFNAGLAHVAEASDTIAAFGVAFYLVKFFNLCAQPLKQVRGRPPRFAGL
jgi:hypothetical protein